ncbi:uncharacterized protein LOC119665892 [Teleopsis dalmanni]|uniref:uncharacterized protein LOC119665892 n=1 Tax=Teleopsis dalmanni TaxID=139649 RepID=UPI0018CFCD20|nr:uncharacterized protein LOC119665892 [Teleopsis dalmanni]
MFTNWLTGSTGIGTNNNVNVENNIASAAVATPTISNSTGTGLMSTPPDVVLEVGPAPSVRFVAHSMVLGMHSGYLRSAIRLDENASIIGHASTNAILYLTNVTPDQFAPLLTYMYTGYLDLNLENIFGVLLATHVLHMPRALEICRTFLARAQTEGYLNNSIPNLANTLSTLTTANDTVKIIRPIPSKATMPNYGFLPQQLVMQSVNSSVGLATVNENSFKTMPQSYVMPILQEQQKTLRDQNEEIDVDRNSNRNEQENDDEDEEVFIDSNSTTDNEVDTEIDCTISVASKSPSYNIHQSIAKSINACKEKSTIAVERTIKNNKSLESQTQYSNQQTNKTATKINKHVKRKQIFQKPSTSSGLQIAKAPIPASQLDAAENSKVIIDVASCDGPVRFRRILNTAYGHKPDTCAVVPERTQQSVSLSFHQQMAKTISQQRQLLQAEESENSESSGGGGGSAKCSNGPGKNNAKNNTSEIYVCVYCKHTFKSQYCYQKHAKRHLNPLSLNCTSSTGTINALNIDHSHNTNSIHTNTFDANAYTHNQVQSVPTTGIKQNATELLRREVRPLDMNVQYYPCKTCGSKFPSYYFVHKHRKMCHADEELTEGPNSRNGGARDDVVVDGDGDGDGEGGGSNVSNNQKLC